MRKKTPFDKFSQKKSGTIKEAYRQEKRQDRKEREDSINKFYEEKRKSRPAAEPKKAVDREERKHFRPQREEGTARTPVKASGRFSRTEAKEKQEPKSSQPVRATHTPKTKEADPRPGSSSSSSLVMPLNKFVAHAGVCARRDAAELVKQGHVQVNGNVVTEPGFKVNAEDTVKVKGKKVFPSRNLVYILLNKPKDFITTTDDPQGRKTVLDLIKQATTERVYPIGRLDRNTSGVLLLTNDGELAQTLSHPKNQVKKVYEVKLDKPLTKKDFDTILAGINLEDGFVAPDALGYADPRDKSIIGIEIHSGRNRIVRRIFESLQYDVKGLDRVMFAGLTKKNVNRGKWRFLNDKEIRILKHFSKPEKNKKS
jgi:23S rRNA pseudouridine2605 synthase